MENIDFSGFPSVQVPESTNSWLDSFVSDEPINTEESLVSGKADIRGTSDKYRASVKIFLEEHDIRIESFKNPTFRIIYHVLEDLTLPRPGEQMRIRTQQQINLISIILKIIEVHGQIEDLTIATYTLNKEAWGVITDLLQSGRIEKLSLFLASSYSFRDKAYYEFLKTTTLSLQEHYNLSLVFAWLHLKITLAKCGGNYYQFEGSMNYSTNNMAEQILFENRIETYEHDYTLLQSFTSHNNKALEVIGKK